MEVNYANSIIPWLDKSSKIAVIGDLILDEYLIGKVHRINPEAPVPVHHVKETSQCIGGAANTAKNIVCCGGQAFIFGIVGDDDSGTALKRLILDSSILTNGIITVKNRTTTKKTRITADNQQLLRIDKEFTAPITKDIQKAIFVNLIKDNYNAIIISDYGKGLLDEDFIQQIISYAKKMNIPIIIDPKGKNYLKYKNATLVTPNYNEACESLGLDPIQSFAAEDLARKIKIKYNIQNVLVTMGAKGMLLLKDNKPEHTIYRQKALAKEVYDVSGAGDTVVAVMALGLSVGLDVNNAMEFANIAGAVVVGKNGTQPIYIRELKQAVTIHKNNEKPISKYKILDRSELESTRIIASGKTIIFTNGCFDILHAGHISYLEKAKQLGDILVVGVNSDESISRLKGKKRPIISLNNRLTLLAALSCIDYVVSFNEDTPLDIIKLLEPNILVKGADWDEENIIGADFVKSKGGTIQLIKYIDGLSTSSIIAKITKVEAN